MRLVFDDTPYRMSFEEFLDFEDGNTFRHEYFGGAVYAMVGGTRNHNRLALRLATRSMPVAELHGCRTYVNDVLLKVDADAFYPDLMVACGPEVHPRYETHPCLIVEVTSPSTERGDRSYKHAIYTKIESVLAYVLVSGNPETPWVEVHRRAGDLWIRKRLGPTDQLTLTCPEITIDLADLFRA